MNKKTGIIIQARTASTRLPKKIILAVDEDLTFFDILLSGLANSKLNIPIIIATTTEVYDDELIPYAEKYDFPVFRGSENNVLDRFIKAAEYFELDQIIRICSDNPFLDMNLMQEMIDSYQDEDYLSFQISGTPTILTHYGFFAEMVSIEALKKVAEWNNSKCIEHVTNCIYSHPDEFNVRLIPLSLGADNIRCTLDSLQDFENLKFIYQKHLKGISQKEHNYMNIISFIQSNPSLLENMKTQIQKQSK